MTDYIICWLIVFGLAFSIANTDGPLGLFEKTRKYIQQKFPKESRHNWIFYGIECPICIGFWVSIPTAFLMGGGVAMWLSSIGFVAAVMVLAPESPE